MHNFGHKYILKSVIVFSWKYSTKYCLGKYRCHWYKREWTGPGRIPAAGFMLMIFDT